MKKILMAFSLFLFVGMVSNAQTCAKTGAKCCAKKSAEAKSASATTSVASAIVEADVVADADETISKRVCDKTGTVSYYQKSVCEVSGKVSYDEVKFCDNSKKFTKVAAASMEKDAETGDVIEGTAKKECTPAEKAACAKKGIKCASSDKKVGS